jgi:zinc protease
MTMRRPYAQVLPSFVPTVFLLATFLLALPTASAADVERLDSVKGAQVWLVEDHTVPVIAMTASLPAGSAYDPAAKAGLAAMAAYLLEEGAGRFSGDDFHAALDDRAIQLTVEPGRDSLQVSLKVLSADARDAFRMLGLALSRPHFDYEAITRQRLAMMQDIDRDRADSAAFAWDGFHSFYYGAHAYGHPVGGAKTGVVAITREDLRAFAAGHWVRGGLKVAISGDVTPAEAKALLRSAFAALPARAPAPPAAPAFVGAPGLHVLALNTPQPDAVFALPGLMRRDPDFLAGLIANLILGGGENSRLNRNLRENRGLTYDVSTDLVTYAKSGVMIGEVQTRREDMRSALTIMRETLRKFAIEGPTPQEFTDAKLYLRGSFPLAFTSNEDTARQLVGFMADGLPMDYLPRHARLIDAIGIDDVRRVARRLYSSERITIVVAGSLPAEKRSSNPYRE